MWPFRPDRLTDVFSEEEIRALLLLGEEVGSAVTFVEALPDGGFRSLDPHPRRDERRPDPFCSFFRHGLVGAEPAFAGADAACAECEQSLARLLLRPPDGYRGDPSWRRCHMGLVDFQSPVEVGGRVIGSVIAGRVVREDAARERIRKIVARIGAQTRAEQGDVAIRPASEKVRRRLSQEIADVPEATDDLPRRLADFARRLGDLAARQFRVKQLVVEEDLLAVVERWPREVPPSTGDLRRQMAATLDLIRGRLGIDYLAFMARRPGGLDDESDVRLPLIAESGLAQAVGARKIGLIRDRIRFEPDGAMEMASRGRDTVIAVIGALVEEVQTSNGLKDTLAGAAFCAPIELRPGREVAVFFGRPGSTVPPVEEDHVLLVRLAASLARRYYALALEVDRGRIADRARKRDEQADKLRGTLQEIKAAEREARETKGFTDFDAPKLVRSRVEQAAEAASARGVEIDSRSLPDRLPVRAHRAMIGEALDLLLRFGIERSLPTRQGGSPSPVRVFLKKGTKTVTFGVEAIGELLSSDERRRLLRRPARARRGRQDGDGAGERPRGSDPDAPDLDLAFRVARRHRGRFRLESERLHRFDDDPKRWVARLELTLELPATVVRMKEGGKAGRQA